MYSRITINPEQMGGVPCIRGMRIPVATVVRMVAGGLSVSEIIEYHPELEPEDIQQSLDYAAEAVAEPVLPVSKPA